MRHAIIENGLVINVTLWDGETEWAPPEGTTVVACPDSVGPDWTYDGVEFTEPSYIQNFIAETPLLKIDFLRLFTQAERIAIKEEAKTNPVVEDYQYMVDNSTMILLSDPDIESGIPILESLGLIAEGRAAQILSGVRP